MLQSTMYGMIFAFGFLLAHKAKLFDDSSNSDLFSRPVSIVVGLLAALGFLVPRQSLDILL